MAVKFHPDRNSTPGADEAFKKVGGNIKIQKDVRDIYSDRYLLHTRYYQTLKRKGVMTLVVKIRTFSVPKANLEVAQISEEDSMFNIFNLVETPVSNFKVLL